MNFDEFNILLVGAGQLGSRYLEGLVRSKCKLIISVVDTSASSLEVARSRWLRAGGEQSHHKVQWLESVPKGLASLDLVLILTSARDRAALVERIASQIKVRFWILEKVLCQSATEADAISQATGQGQGSWVNTPRRMMPWHQAFRRVINSNSPIQATYSGNSWGLACNSIHFLDFISWLTAEDLSSIDTRDLDSLWFESKRPDYFEVNGRLIAYYSRGSSLSLEARQETVTRRLRVDLADGTVWKLDEVNGIAFSSTGERINGGLDLQSQLSARLVDGILLRGECDLPTLQESVKIHKVFLDAMLKHWNLSKNRYDLRVPIT